MCRSMLVIGCFALACSWTANACDFNAVKRALETRNFAAAEELASETGDDWCLQAQADAKFHQGKEAEAFGLYASSWARQLDHALDDTKGSSRFWSGVGKAVGALAMASSVYAVGQGSIPAEQANATMLQGQQLISKIDDDFKMALGSKNHREDVKAAAKDLEILARKGSGSLKVLNPYWSTIPGAAMARVHVNGVLCNAIRLAKRKYVASYSCVASGGIANEKFVSMGSSLEVDEFARVVGFRRIGRTDGLAELEVDPASTSQVATSEWIPQIYPGGADFHWLARRYAAVWYADEFSNIVPVFQECLSVKYEACGNIGEDHAILWISECVNPTCQWDFYGIADAEGVVQRLSSMDRL